jgi:hypothetical protein
MKKHMTLWHLVYYAGSLLVYLGFFFGFSRLLELSGAADNLGAVMAATYGLLFIGTPLVVIVLVRMSFLRWYVDPFAAAQIPLLLYIMMVVNRVRLTGSLSAALEKVNGSLLQDGGEGCLFLAGLFLLGLLASFSPARKEGRSLAYRVIARLPF